MRREAASCAVCDLAMAFDKRVRVSHKLKRKKPTSKNEEKEKVPYPYRPLGDGHAVAGMLDGGFGTRRGRCLRFG